MLQLWTCLVFSSPLVSYFETITIHENFIFISFDLDQIPFAQLLSIVYLLGNASQLMHIMFNTYQLCVM